MAEQTRDLLIELGTEELPPKALPVLSEVLEREIVKGLADAGLTHGAVVRYASPRRLAVVIEDLQTRQADRMIERKGPALSAAFRDGEPTKAALGFARSCGVALDELDELRTDEGAWLLYKTEQPGEAAAALIPDIFRQALNRLPIPKRMRWGAGAAAFVRPVHWLVMLLGDEVIDAEVLGVPTGRTTQGHRFHCDAPIELRTPAEYARRLEEEGFVIADFAARRERVRAQTEALAESIDAQAVLESELLDEVTALVEWPVAILGSFDEAFLSVPAEALISSMQEHQRYFPLRDRDGALLPRFITVANIDSRNPDAVREGNERVIRPRLADAAFFWDQDRRQRLETRRAALAKVVYQSRLGTVLDKSERVAAIAAETAEALGVDRNLAVRAAQLGKCDLNTQMVDEFPELQGVMGRYYAQHDGEPEAVAVALEEQYQPRFGGDRIAASPVGQVLAIAERVDTLVGIFAIGRQPSGDKDPFALRRTALGMMRTLVEGELDLDLDWLLQLSARALPESVNADAVLEAVFDFCMDRLRAYYGDRGYRPELFEAVAATKPTRPWDFHRRIEACRAFLTLPEAESLAAANKRIRNILRRNEAPLPDAVTESLLEDAPERALATAVEAARQEVTPMLKQGQYQEALQRLAALREPVDAFFDHVLVMAEDAQVRSNRLRLLLDTAELFFGVADVSRLPG